jgi:hypothetical protein
VGVSRPDGRGQGIQHLRALAPTVETNSTVVALSSSTGSDRNNLGDRMRTGLVLAGSLLLFWLICGTAHADTIDHYIATDQVVNLTPTSYTEDWGPTETSEPSSMLLMGTGLVGLGFMAKKRLAIF